MTELVRDQNMVNLKIKKNDPIFCSKFLYKFISNLINGGNIIFFEKLYYILLKQLFFISSFKCFRNKLCILIFYELIIKLIVFFKLKIIKPKTIKQTKKNLKNKKIIPIKLIKNKRFIVAIKWFNIKLLTIKNKKILWRIFNEIYILLFLSATSAVKKKKKNYKILLLNNQTNITYQ